MSWRDLRDDVRDGDLNPTYLTQDGGETVKDWTPIKEVTEKKLRDAEAAKSGKKIKKEKDIWFIKDSNGERIGPLSEKKLHKLVHKSKTDDLSPQSMITNNAQLKWKWKPYFSVFPTDADEKKQFYVWVTPQMKLGPFTEKQVVTSVKKKKVPVESLCWDGDKVSEPTPIKFVPFLCEKIFELGEHQWFFILNSGKGQSGKLKRKGPFSLEKLEKKMKKGIVNETTLVVNGVTVTEWVELRDIDELLQKLYEVRGRPRGKKRIYPQGVGQPRKPPSLASIVLEVDDLEHKKFISEMLQQRARLFAIRNRKDTERKLAEALEAERVKAAEDERLKRLEQEGKRPVKVRPLDSIHEQAAATGCQWRRKQLEKKGFQHAISKEYRGKGCRKRVSPRNKWRHHPQSNTCIQRIERLCLALDQIKPFESNLIEKVQEFFERAQQALDKAAGVMTRARRQEIVVGILRERERHLELERIAANAKRREKLAKQQSWYIGDREKKRHGPMNWGELEALYMKSADFNQECYVFNHHYVDFQEWIKIKQHNRLHSIFSKIDKIKEIELKRTWYITDTQRQRHGPLLLADLVELYQSAKGTLFTVECQVFNQRLKRLQQWTPIREVPKLMEMLENGVIEDGLQTPDGLSEELVVDPNKVQHWHVVDKNKKRWGPLSVEEILGIKEIDGNAKVWNGKNVKTWTKITEVEEFKGHYDDHPQAADEKKAGDEKDGGEFGGFVKEEDPFKKYRWNVLDINNKKHEDLDFDVLERMFKEEHTLNKQSYVLNGETIKTWTQIHMNKPLLERLMGKKQSHGFGDGAKKEPAKAPAPVKKTVKQGPAIWFVIGKQKQKIGPLSVQQLNALVKQGKVVDIRSLVMNGTTVKEWTPYLKVLKDMHLTREEPQEDVNDNLNLGDMFSVPS